MPAEIADALEGRGLAKILPEPERDGGELEAGLAAPPILHGFTPFAYWRIFVGALGLWGVLLFK